MKITDPASSGDERWNDLVRRAREDAPPASDTAALLRTLRAAEIEPPRSGWFGEFATLFAGGRAVAACLASAAAFALFAGWQAWTLWQALPWAQLIAVTTGGAP